MIDDDATEPTTEELRAVQRDRVEDERARAAHADSEADERAHERRAAKAAYLAEKLALKEASEKEAEGK